MKKFVVKYGWLVLILLVGYGGCLGQMIHTQSQQEAQWEVDRAQQEAQWEADRAREEAEMVAKRARKDTEACRVAYVQVAYYKATQKSVEYHFTINEMAKGGQACFRRGDEKRAASIHEFLQVVEAGP